MKDALNRIADLVEIYVVPALLAVMTIVGIAIAFQPIREAVKAMLGI